jgi:prolyl-tRNA synthetase
MFADMELIGVPHRVVISERNLAVGQVEYRGRCEAASMQVARENLLDWLRERWIAE